MHWATALYALNAPMLFVAPIIISGSSLLPAILLYECRSEKVTPLARLGRPGLKEGVNTKLKPSREWASLGHSFGFDEEENEILDSETENQTNPRCQRMLKVWRDG